MSSLRLNNSFKKPLVVKTTGGSHGGGAELTPLGQDVLKHYLDLIKITEKQGKQAFQNITRHLKK